MLRYVFLSIVSVIVGCTTIPQGIEPVTEFELNRYLGKWYEIARLDHDFERGLEQVSAEYFLREDGGVKVINRGYDPDNKTWKEAEGKAYFVREEGEGYMKVSFFGPFYGAYIIFELDQDDYQYAFITGPNKSYLWLLSRTPIVKPELIAFFQKRAKALGFYTEELIFVRQNNDHQT